MIFVETTYDLCAIRVRIRQTNSQLVEVDKERYSKVTVSA